MPHKYWLMGRALAITAVLYLTTALGAAVAPAFAADPAVSCEWTPEIESTFRTLISALYGDSVSGYMIDSVKLVSYDGDPLTCTYRVTLKNKVTNAELLINVYEMYGRVVEYRIYLPPVERLRAVPLGDVDEEGVFRLTPEALKEIDRVIQAVREVLTAPSLGDAVINLSEAAPDGLILGRGFMSTDNELFKRGAAKVRLGRGLTAEIVYLWSGGDMDSLTVHIHKSFSVGPGAEVKYYVIGVQFLKLRGEWVPYSAHAVPFPVRLDKVSTPPSAYLRKAEEAALQKAGASCRVMKASFTEAWAMSPPKLVNGSLYLSSITYVYDIGIDCGDRKIPIRVLVDASTGSIRDVSVGMAQIVSGDEGGGEVSLEVSPEYLAVGAASAAVAALAFAVLRRRS